MTTRWTRVRPGLYQATLDGTRVEVEHYQFRDWTFYLDGERAADGWLTRREATAVALDTLAARRERDDVESRWGGVA